MPSRQDRHHAWMDDFFASYHARRPVSATFIGVHDHDDRLPDFSENGIGDLLADVEDLLARDATDPGPWVPSTRGSADASPRSPTDERTGDPAATTKGRPDVGDALTASEAIDRRLARGYLRSQRWEVGSDHFHRGNPSLYTGEAAFGVIGLLLTDFAPLPERVEAATGRMSRIPAFLERARDNVRHAPVAWTERAIRECDGALALFTDGIAEVAASNGIESKGLADAADGAARAFAEHRVHLESELLARPRPDHACGAEALDLHLREAHCLRENAAEVLEHALDAIEEADAHLRGHAADFGASTPTEALAALADLHPSADDYYAAYTRVWDEVRRISDERRLLTWPDAPIRYVPRPAWVRSAAPHLYFLFYRSPAAHGRPPVPDYLVAPLPDGDSTAFLRAHNDSVIKLNHVVHHGGLGHHVQNWHAYRAESRVGRMAAVDCASRIAMLCGGTMAEGWACYATDLAAEAGALTPLERYAEAHARVRMAARAIVDVRLHSGAITLEEAAGFYEARAGMSADAARGEAVKNSMFPGAALMYLVGTDAIHELRAEMARRRGAAFDLRRFHDDLLAHGSIPVSLIADQMTKDTVDAE